VHSGSNHPALDRRHPERSRFSGVGRDLARTKRHAEIELQHYPRPHMNTAAATQTFQLTVQGHSLEILRIPGHIPHAPELVFLHEGLGSVSHWKDFPARVADATGSPVTVYSRYGSGNSDLLTEDRAVTYMHDEALIVLPDLLAQLEIDNPILIGHSDGASIALIHAGAQDRVRGLVLLAPHVFVEDLSVASIAEAKVKFLTTNLPEKLSRHHRDGTRTFWGWNNIWLHPDFRRWNIEEYLPRITCPILSIQGIDDQYGTMAQGEAIAKQSAGPVEILALPDCRHSPQRDQPEAVLEAITKFVAAIFGNKSNQTDV
jgi:pimeloyl-ACP methyl ester carboxylesterase